MKAEAIFRALTAAVLGLALSGCHHKVVQATLPAQVPPQPVAPDSPTILEPPMVASSPPDLKPQESPTVVVKKPRTVKKKPAPATPPPAPTTQVAANGPAVGPPSEETPENSPIGALSPGGDTNPQVKKEAGDLIADISKRLNGLPADVLQHQKSQINKVRQFVREAQKALASGDAEGAKTLAVKAKLLLDDVKK